MIILPPMNNLRTLCGECLLQPILSYLVVYRDGICFSSNVETSWEGTEDSCLTIIALSVREAYMEGCAIPLFIFQTGSLAPRCRRGQKRRHSRRVEGFEQIFLSIGASLLSLFGLVWKSTT